MLPLKHREWRFSMPSKQKQVPKGNETERSMLTTTPFSLKSKFIRSFQAKDAQQQHDRTSIRYHYTSAGALMKILNTEGKGYGSVRFTDSRYLNDRSEHLYFVKRLLEFMEKNRKDYPFCQEVINELLLKDHSAEDYTSLRISGFGRPLYESVESEKQESSDRIHSLSFLLSHLNTHNYLFCLSKDNDSLHMWNYYVHNGNYQGYNIGIKIYDFLKCFDCDDDERPDGFIFSCGDVLYEPKKQEAEIEALCNSIENEGTVEKISETEYRTVLTNGMLKLWFYILNFGLFFKDESFSDEKEYRIVIQYNELDGYSAPLATRLNSEKRNIRYTFFERNGVIVPCLDVPLSKEAVKAIRLAPIMESYIASASMKEFLDSNGYSDVDVKQSTIPIRF